MGYIHSNALEAAVIKNYSQTKANILFCKYIYQI